MLLLLQAMPSVSPVQAAFSKIPTLWYSEPDVWAVIGTIALAFVTSLLALYTYPIFKAAKDARTEAEAIKVSKESVEYSLKSYVVLSGIENLNVGRHSTKPAGHCVRGSVSALEPKTE